jgi:hypothetical protein
MDQVQKLSNPGLMCLFVTVIQETARLILWLLNFIFSTAWGVERQVRLKDSY